MTATEIVAAGQQPAGAEGAATLKQQLHRSQRVYKRRTWMLVAPLLAFILIIFVVPIASILINSVANPEIRDGMPGVTAALKRWDGAGVPDENTFRAVVVDLRKARAEGQIASVAKRMSYEDSAYRGLIMRTLHAAPQNDAAPGTREALIGALPLWGENATWRSLQRASRPFTSYYLLAVFDRKVDPQTGNIVKLADTDALFVNVLFRTLLMAAVVTLFFVAVGYPLAYWLSKQPDRRANLL